MSANAEGKASDSAGSATVSDDNDTVQHTINTSSVVILKRMTCSVACKVNSGAVKGQIVGCMGVSQGCNVAGHAEALGTNSHGQHQAFMTSQLLSSRIVLCSGCHAGRHVCVCINCTSATYMVETVFVYLMTQQMLSQRHRCLQQLAALLWFHL